MKNLAIIILLVVSLTSCNAQKNEGNNEKHTDISKEKIQPKIDYKVNKEYDENGNLIRFDSTYTYYYSNIDKDAMMNDSIFKKFNEYFNRKSPFDDSVFNDFFKQDNYLENSFFSEDFFRGNYKRNNEMMEKMLTKMDSLKNRYFMEQYPLKEEKGKLNEADKF